MWFSVECQHFFELLLGVVFHSLCFMCLINGKSFLFGGWFEWGFRLPYPYPLEAHCSLATEKNHFQAKKWRIWFSIFFCFSDFVVNPESTNKKKTRGTERNGTRLTLTKSRDFHQNSNEWNEEMITSHISLWQCIRTLHPKQMKNKTPKRTW